MNAPTSETSVSITEQLGEAFQLGSVLARIETGQVNMGKVVDKIDGTVTGMSERMGVVEVTLGRHAEQIVTAFQRLDALDRRDTGHNDHVSRQEFSELKTEVASGRLSWPKIGALITALGGIAGLFLYFDNLTPGT